MAGAGGDGSAAPCQGGTGVSCTDNSFATNHSELHLEQLLAQNVQLPQRCTLLPHRGPHIELDQRTRSPRPVSQRDAAPLLAHTCVESRLTHARACAVPAAPGSCGARLDEARFQHLQDRALNTIPKVFITRALCAVQQLYHTVTCLSAHACL
jgi:hypothetical protein